MNQIEEIERISSELTAIGSYWRINGETDEEYDIRKKRTNELAAQRQTLIKNLVESFFSTEYHFVKMLHISQAVVPAELVPFCIYENGNYHGFACVDDNNQLYSSIDEAKSALGPNTICFTASYHIVREYKYIPEINRIVVRTTEVNCKCGYNGELYPGLENFEDFISKRERTYAIIDKDLHVISSSFSCYQTVESIDKLNIAEDRGTQINLMTSIKQLFELKSGIVNIGANKYVPLDNIANINSYASHSAQMQYKHGKLQDKIDALVAMRDFESEKICGRLPHEYYSLCSKTMISRITDNIVCIRWTYNYQDETFDGMRVYLEGKNVYACKRNNEGLYVKMSIANLSPQNFASEFGGEIVMDDMQGTRLQYYASIIDSIPEDYRITMLMLFLANDRIEQLVKMGFGPSVYGTINQFNKNPIKMLDKFIGFDKDAKTIYGWLGANKYQLDQIKKFCASKDHDAHALIMLGYIKSAFFGGQSIQAEDNKVFDAAMKAYKYVYEKTGRVNGIGAVEERRWRYGQLTILDIQNYTSKWFDYATNNDENRNLIKYLPTLFSTIAGVERHIVESLNDYYDMVNKMGIRNLVKLYPESQEEIKLLHDNTVAVFNMQKDKYQTVGFKTYTEKIKNLEYSNEEMDFQVVVPTEPKDLVIEGNALHHCVKSYIDRVANGKTNILFIRKKDAIDTPFFTVEVTPDRVIRQVHGFSNRNANTEPGMVDFVARWAKNKRLHIGNYTSVYG